MRRISRSWKRGSSHWLSKRGRSRLDGFGISFLLKFKGQVISWRRCNGRKIQFIIAEALDMPGLIG
jgi:hypothetical protein